MEANLNKGVMVIVAYRPKPGKAARLLELTKEHAAILRGQGLATERPAYAMRAADGTIIEVFEWRSQAAIDAAHTNPVVLKMWERYAEACDYVPLVQVKECGDLFAGFAPVDLK
jgi:quinol monooxygenase YgiN